LLEGLVTVNVVAWHSMLVELHSGMIALAAICIIATVIARSQLKTLSKSESNSFFWPVDCLAGKVASYTEPTGYVATMVGIIGLIASAIVGFYVFPMKFVTTSALVLSHILFSVCAMILLVEFVVIRLRYGEKLWKNGGTAAVYSCLGILGFLFIVIAGSFGGHIAGIGSVLDPLYALLKIKPETLGVTGISFVITLVSAAVVEIAVPIAVFLLLQHRNKTQK